MVISKEKGGKPVKWFYCILATFMIITGCSTTTNSNDNTELPKQISVKPISQENIYHWKITISPKLSNDKWVCDIKAEYIGDLPTGSVSLQGGGGIIQTRGVKPHDYIQFNDYVLKMNRNIELNLTWEENSRELKGKAVFEVKPIQ